MSRLETLSLVVLSAVVALRPPAEGATVRLEVGTPYSKRHTPEDGARPAVPESTRGSVRVQELYEHGEPTVWEQYFLELVNRARADPTAEAELYGIGLNDPHGGQPAPDPPITADPKQPLAFNPFLFDSARDHSTWLLEVNEFQHEGPPGLLHLEDRIKTAGYPLVDNLGWGIGENLAVIWGVDVLAGGLREAVDESHEGLVLSPGHRGNLMADDFREIGIGSVRGDYTLGEDVYDTLMSTHNFARSGASPAAAPGSSFLLGVVSEDTDGDGFYSPGEGMGGVTVTPSAGGFYAVTSASGGYAMPLPTSRAPVRVTVSGGGWDPTMAFVAEVNGANLKADFVFDPAGPPAREFEVEAAVTWVPEGEVGQLRVRLTERPHSDVTARVSWESGDPDLGPSGSGEVTFTVEDFGFHDVALEAGEDNGDTISGSAQFRIEKVAGVNPIADLTGVQVRELDDDVVISMRSNGPGTTEPEGEVIVDTNAMPLAIRAVPNADASFVEWRAVGATINLPNSVEAEATAATNATVTAYFSISDTDLDGLDDQWEEDNFGDLDQTADGDPDGDRITNREEMVAGLDPEQPDDGVRVIVLDRGWNVVSLPTGTQAPTKAAVFGRSHRGPVWVWDAVLQTWDKAEDPLSDLKGYWLYAPDQAALIVAVAARRGDGE